MTFAFDWFSIIFLIIIIFYMILGIAKGVGHMLLNFVSTFFVVIGSLILGCLLGPIIGSVTGLQSFFVPNMKAFFESASSIFATNNPGRELVAQAVMANDYGALTAVGIPGFVGPLLLAALLPNIPVEATEIPVSQYAAETVLSIIFALVAFLIFYTIFGIIFEIIKGKRRKKQKKDKEEGIYKKPNGFGRFLGAIFGIFVGFVMVFFILWIFKIFLFQIEQIRQFFSFIWSLDDASTITIGKWLYMNNPFSSVLLWIFKLFNI